MLVKNLIEEINEKKIVNTKIAPTALEDYLYNTLEVREYVPFEEKRKIIEIVVQKNITEDNGVKKINSISQYIGFTMAVLIMHTNLEIVNPFEDYDVLCESNLLEIIIKLFEKDFTECNTLLKMIINNELEDNNLNNIVAKFLDNILNKMDVFGDAVKGSLENIDIGKIFTSEDLARLGEFLHKD